MNDKEKYQVQKRFEQSMEQLAKTHERSKVYVDFMDYYIYQNSKSKDKTLPHGYTEKDMQLFQEAYQSFTQYNKQQIRDHGWYDYIGEYYEEYVLAGHKASTKGQYYTPRQISQLLSDVVGHNITMNEAYDPACGSARNLLDYHSQNPDVRCTGEDVDESACKMAVINFHLHGVDGVVNWIDALTREYMGVSWRILEGMIIVTDLDWIRAVEDVRDAVSILSLSDETLARIMSTVAKTMPIENTSGKNSTGLDAWIT